MTSIYDEMDRLFIENIYPKYLLQQPVGNYLRLLYYKNREDFMKIKNKKKIVDNAKYDFTTDQNSLDYNKYVIKTKLPCTVRKKMWQKLMKLGVLGTISFETTDDEYLIKTYKYFYPDSLTKTFDSLKSSDTAILATNKSSNPAKKPIEDILADFSKPVRLESEIIEDESEEGNSSVNINDGEDEEGYFTDEIDFSSNPIVIRRDEPSESSSHSDSEEDSDNSSESDGIERSLSRSTFAGEKSARKSMLPPQVEIIGIHPSNSSQKESLRSKNNDIHHQMYADLGYFLPTRWMTQRNNAVAISQDGISRMSPNENWRSLRSDRDQESSNRTNARQSFSNKMKSDFAVTWANNVIAPSVLAIYYYEIRVINITISEGVQNGSIIVGFKDHSEIEKEDSESLARSTQESSTSSRSHIASRNAIGIRTSGVSLNGRLSGEDISDSTKNELGAGIYGYCGIDGNILGESEHKSYAKPFGRDDVIGCGVNFIDGSIFFTKNGTYLGPAYQGIENITLIPYIALKSTNSVATNFGLYEEFIFDIVGYQEKWKTNSYKHIFKTIEKARITDFEKIDLKNIFPSTVNSNDRSAMDIDDQIELIDNSQGVSNSKHNTANREYNDQFFMRDSRLNDGVLSKPETPTINNINTNDDSLQSLLKTVVNDYLVHEGLIDVAKGFLNDLKEDSIIGDISIDYIDRNQQVLKHNEKQIVQEEKNLIVRQNVRRLINGGNIIECISYIHTEFPTLLEDDIELDFEMNLANYQNSILLSKVDDIEAVILSANHLTSTFVYNQNIPLNTRMLFKEKFDIVSSILSYEDPINEAPEELFNYLSHDFLKDKLFQIINNAILKHLQKAKYNSLENMIKYTRGMLSTLNENESGSSISDNDRTKNDYKYYKIINLDEDLLNFN